MCLCPLFCLFSPFYSAPGIHQPFECFRIFSLLFLHSHQHHRPFHCYENDRLLQNRRHGMQYPILLEICRLYPTLDPPSYHSLRTPCDQSRAHFEWNCKTREKLILLASIFGKRSPHLAPTKCAEEINELVERTQVGDSNVTWK